MADVPLFFHPEITAQPGLLALSEETAKHIGQVLRMKAGEQIQLTNGFGLLAHGILAEVGKKRMNILIEKLESIPQPAPRLHLAVAFTKNTSRNEWLLEKATELGVSSITPLITDRSVRERIRLERWQNILISAILQSKQCWLPVLYEPAHLDATLKQDIAQKLIAHCIEDGPRVPITEALKRVADTQILIGPEGDFTAAEVTLAKAAGAVPVSLGTNRLRTETAALAAITHFYLTNHAA